MEIRENVTAHLPLKSFFFFNSYSNYLQSFYLEDYFSILFCYYINIYIDIYYIYILIYYINIYIDIYYIY